MRPFLLCHFFLLHFFGTIFCADHSPLIVDWAPPPAARRRVERIDDADEADDIARRMAKEIGYALNEVGNGGN